MWDHVPPVLRVASDSAVYCQTYLQVTRGFRRDLLYNSPKLLTSVYTVIQAQTLPTKKATEFISVMDETKSNGSRDSFPWPRTISGTVRPSVVHVEVPHLGGESPLLTESVTQRYSSLTLTLNVIRNTGLDNAPGPGMVVLTLDSRKMNAKSVLLKQTEVLERH